MTLLTYVKLIIVAAAIAITAAPAAGTDWYLNPSHSGTETGLSPLTPFNTFSEVQSAAASGDRVLIWGSADGTIYRDVLGSGRSWSSTGKVITMLPWPGTGTPIISGAVGVTSASLTNVAADVWKFNVAATEAVTAVTVNYYTNAVKAAAPAKGARCGWYTEVRTGTPANDLTTVLSTAEAWAVSADTGAGEVHVNIPGSGTTPPADNVIEWTRGTGGNAISITSGNGSLISGLSFDRVDARYDDLANGAALLFTTCTDVLVTNCTFYDMRDKHVGFTGTINTNNAVTYCQFWGTTARVPDSQVNFFTTSGTVTGARVKNCEFHACGLYKGDDHTAVLAPRPEWSSSSYGNAALGMVAAHVNSVGSQFIGDLEVSDCTFDTDPQFWMGTATAAYPGSATLVYATGTQGVNGSPWYVASYPVRLVRCTFTYGMGHYQTSAAAVAFDRCVIAHNSGKVNVQYQYNTSSFGTHGFTTGTTNSTMLISGCDVSTTCEATSTNGTAFLTMGNNSSVTANIQLYGVKSTFRDCSTLETNQPQIMIEPLSGTDANVKTSTSRMSFAKCAFIGVRDVAGVLTGVESGAAGSYARRYLTFSASDHSAETIRHVFRFDECFYYGMPTTGTSTGGFAGNTGGTAINDASEWTSANPAVGMDRAGITGTAPLLLSAMTSAEPSAASPLNTPRSAAFEEILGINNRPGRNIGCYQTGQPVRARTWWSAILGRDHVHVATAPSLPDLGIDSSRVHAGGGRGGGLALVSQLAARRHQRFGVQGPDRLVLRNR